MRLLGYAGSIIQKKYVIKKYTQSRLNLESKAMIQMCGIKRLDVCPLEMEHRQQLGSKVSMILEKNFNSGTKPQLGIN